MLAAGDRRLLDTRDRAASITFDYAERHVAVTRIRQGREVERVASDNLVFAAFSHVTARATDDMPAPQLHTHGVAFNMTQGPDGTWRSIESRDLYRLQKELGGIYHQALAAEIINSATPSPSRPMARSRSTACPSTCARASPAKRLPCQNPRINVISVQFLSADMGSYIGTKEFTLKVRILMICAGLGASGAAKAQETTTYTYDALGRLVSSKTSGSQNVTTNIRYDAASNRTNFTVAGAVNSSSDPGASAGAPTIKKFVVVPLNGFTIIPIN